MSSMPGLKTFFEMFDNRILRMFFDSQAPSLAPALDWRKRGKGLAEDVFIAVSRLKSSNPDLFHKLYPVFSDIYILSEKSKDANYYLKQLQKDAGLNVRFHTFFRTPMTSINDMVMWIKLEAPQLFDALLARKLASTKNAAGGSRYYLPSTYDGKINALGTFRKSLKEYLKTEVGFNIRVHLEKNDLPDCVRFVVTTDPFPQNEPQFKDNGSDDDLSVGLKKSAECFYITLVDRTVRKPAHFMIRCEFTKSQKEAIAVMFARDVLGTRTGVRPQQVRSLDSFRRKPPVFELPDAEPDFRELRYTGVYMEIESGGTKPELYMRKFNGDLYEMIEKRGELKEIPEEHKKILELYLEVEIVTGEPPELVQGDFLDPCKTDDLRKVRTYSLTVPRNGEWKVSPKPSRIDERKLDRILTAMGLMDVGGDLTLKTVTRK